MPNLFGSKSSMTNARANTEQNQNFCDQKEFNLGNMKINLLLLTLQTKFSFFLDSI